MGCRQKQTIKQEVPRWFSTFLLFHVQNSGIKTFQDVYQHLSSCHKMYEEIVYKIISCIMQLKALNQHATATKVAKQIDSSPEVVLTHLKHMHDDKLVTFPTV